MKCEDCGTDKNLVGDLKGMLCAECMDERQIEHYVHSLLEKVRKHKHQIHILRKAITLLCSPEQYDNEDAKFRKFLNRKSLVEAYLAFGGKV